MGTFPKYKLTDAQIKGIANIVAHEQGTDNEAGMYAEASLIANRTDIKGDEYATTENLIKTVTGGWFAYGKSRFETGTTNAKAIKAVKDVIVLGKRTLPHYIDEHDCLSDISYVENGIKSDKSTWVKHKTVIYNRFTSRYKFYSFPGGIKTGVDPFGYTSDEMRKKLGEFCYTLEEAKGIVVVKQPYSGTFPVLPDKSFGVNRAYYQIGDGITTLTNYTTQIKRVQMVVNWAIGSNLTVDGQYGTKTAEAVKILQKKAGCDQNGKFGALCLAYCKKLKK